MASQTAARQLKLKRKGLLLVDGIQSSGAYFASHLPALTGWAPGPSRVSCWEQWLVVSYPRNVPWEIWSDQHWFSASLCLACWQLPFLPRPYHITPSRDGHSALPASLLTWQPHGSPTAGHRICSRTQLQFPSPPSGRSPPQHPHPPDTTYDMSIARARTSFFHTKIKKHISLT